MIGGPWTSDYRHYSALAATQGAGNLRPGHMDRRARVLRGLPSHGQGTKATLTPPVVLNFVPHGPVTLRCTTWNTRVSPATRRRELAGLAPPRARPSCRSIRRPTARVNLCSAVRLIVHERKQEMQTSPGVAWRAVRDRRGLFDHEVEALDSYSKALALDPAVVAAFATIYPVLGAAMAEKNWDDSRPRWLHKQFGI